MTTIEQIRQLALLGGSVREIAATIGRDLTPDERTVYDRARMAAKIRDARDRQSRRPMSGAERVAKHVAAQNEIGEIPPVRHPRLRERCRLDLEAYGWFYCRQLLDHRASALIRSRLIDKLQDVILSGGQLDVMFTRGGGKTTWTAIALCWAIDYGHRRFPVVIAATSAAAKSILKTVVRIHETSPGIRADFPAVALPIVALRGVVQRAASQTYHGTPTRIATGSNHFAFPDLRTESGDLLDLGCAAVIGAVGVGGSVRGLNEMGVRPDCILFDDPQTKKDANSPSRVSWIESFIHQDALGLAAHTSGLAAMMTITPQRWGDVAMRIASKADHPEWSVTRQPFIDRWCPGHEALVRQFVDAYREDVAVDDFSRSRSTAWYKDHREAFAGTVVIDPLMYDRNREVDAVHHALNIYAKVGDEAWNAEYMMSVAEEGGELAVTPDVVCRALNGEERNVLPPGTTTAVAYCDVNIARNKGLSWVVVAFGRGRVAAVVNYGRYPEDGSPLVKPGSSSLARIRAIAAAVRAVVGHIANLPLRLHGTNKRVNVRALAFDRGYEAAAVSRALHVIRHRFNLPFNVLCTLGRNWRTYGQGHAVRSGDHLAEKASKEFGEFLEIQVDYWREQSQSGFATTPLLPGSTSIFGRDAAKHWEFANEIAAERLVRSFIHPSGKKAWEWATSGENHYGDCLTGAFAIASWFRAYEAAPRVVDAAAASMDLFDPVANPAILAQAAASESSPRLPTLQEWRAAHKPKFKKGKWKK